MTSPMTVIHGNEEFLIERQCRRVLDPIRPNVHLPDMNWIKLDGAELVEGRFTEEVQQLPFGSPVRVVVVRNLQECSEQVGAEIIQWLKLRAQRESPEQIVVGLAIGLDQRKKWIKELLAASEAYECKKPFANQLPRWIAEMAAELDVDISAQATDALLERVGADLQLLQNLLEQIKMYIHPRRVIEFEDALQMSFQGHLESVFSLVTAFASRQFQLTWRRLLLHRDSGGSEIGVVTLLARELRLLRRAKSLRLAQVPVSQWAKDLGIPAFVVDQLRRNSEAWSNVEIAGRLAQLEQIDLGLKTGSKTALLELELLVGQPDMPEGLSLKMRRQTRT